MDESHPPSPFHKELGLKNTIHTLAEVVGLRAATYLVLLTRPLGSSTLHRFDTLSKFYSDHAC